MLRLLLLLRLPRLLMLLLAAILRRQYGGGVQRLSSDLERLGQLMRRLCESKHKSRLFSMPSQLHWKRR